MRKHAYLIMAHNNFEILKRLLLLIDDKRNDIYVHIDKKVTKFNIREFEVLIHYSRIVFLQEIDVKWGHVSQIQLEFLLFKSAYQRGVYSYYHLLSGVDLPLKSQDYIHDFFAAHTSTEFVGFTTPASANDEERVNKIHLFPKSFRTADHKQKYIYKIRKHFINIQKAIHYNHFKQPMVLMKGPTWVSITHELVGYLLSKEKETLLQYKFSFCGDEFFLQTIVGNSPFYNRIYKKSEGNDNVSCLRHIDWMRGEPYVFRSNDYDELILSNRLFARKFDQDVDNEIIDRLYKSKTLKNI